jgi:hypothetical protein
MSSSPPSTGPAAQPDLELLRLWRGGERPDVWDFLARTGPLPLDEVVAVLAVDQQQRWQQGERPLAEGYLEKRPDLRAEAESALELIYGEFLLRERLGESPQPEEYLCRFPAFAARLKEQFECRQALGTLPLSQDAAEQRTAQAFGHMKSVYAFTDPQAAAEESMAPAPETTDGVARAMAGQKSGPLGRIGRFQLQAVLGQGGFGRVYRAYDPQLDRQVALKVPRFAPDDADQVERFLGEAKAAARLRHANIVAVFESGRDGDDYYIVSEFVEGLPLSERLPQDPPGFRQAAIWVRDLARALAYAHAEGVIHRDIKSANVLIDRQGRPQLTDFGLAKRVADEAKRTVEGAVMGTPAYMAPEQARGDLAAVGPHSDQFSLGVVLYELLARRLPFDGPAHQLLLHVIGDDPPPPSRFNPAVPRDLEAICLKAMEKHPARRYGGARDLADDLHRWLAGAPVRARRPGLRERASRWLRRRRHVVFLAAGVSAAVTVTLAAVWWSGGFRTPQPPRSHVEQPLEQAPEAAADPDLQQRWQNTGGRAANLRAIGLAIRGYHAAANQFPQSAIYKDGKPLLSWRVAILPSLGYGELFEAFHREQPWDSPDNLKLLPFMPKSYQAPGDKNANDSYKTYYQAFVGPGAVFDSDPKQFVRLSDVQRDQDSTLLIAEAAEPVEWTRPADLVVEPGKPLPRLGGLSPDVWLACFADNRVRYLKPEICRQEELLHNMINREGHELVNVAPYEIDPLAAQQAAASKDQLKESQDLAAAARQHGRKVASKNNLRNLFLALQNYAKARGVLPPPAIYGKDGAPLLSWRVAILPYLGKKELYDHFMLDEPWDSPDNRKLLEQMPDVFGLRDAPPTDPNTTFYQLFVGPGAYEPSAKRRTIAGIPDGPSHTIAIAEGAKAVPWTAPVDLPYSPDGPLPELGVFPDGFSAVLFDGSTWSFKKEIYEDDRTLRALIGWNDGEAVNLRPYREPLLSAPAKDTLGAASVEAARRVYSQNNLKQLGIALRNYHSARGALPPYAIADKEGKPLLSWRVAILPYLDEAVLYKKFKLDEAWDGPNNRDLLPLMPSVFDIPDAESATANETRYQVFVGPGAGFERDPERRVRLSDLRRPAAETLLVVEAREPVPWTKPADLFVEPDKPFPQFGGPFPNGFYACTFDGYVHFIGAKIYQDEKALRALIDIRSGERVDIESYR